MQIFGVSQYVSIPIAAAAVWGLTVLGSYSRAERLFLVLVLAFLTYPIAAFLGHPNGKEVISNLVWPHFLHTQRVPRALGRAHRHHDHPVHAVLRGLRRGRQGHQARRLPRRADRHGERRHLERCDQHLHHHRHRGRDRRDRSTAVRPRSGEGPRAGGRAAAPALFGLGLLGASLLAASVVPLSTSYAIADAAGAPRSVSASFRQAPLFYGLFTLQIVVGAGVALAPGNLVALVVNAQVLNGIITPMLLTYVLILANRKHVLGTAANGRIFKVVATLCVAVVGVLSFVVLVQTVAGLFGA